MSVKSSSLKRRHDDDDVDRTTVKLLRSCVFPDEQPLNELPIDRLSLLPEDVIAVLDEHLPFLEVLKRVSTRKKDYYSIYTDQWWGSWFAKRTDNMQTLALVIFKHANRYINILLNMSVAQWVDKPQAMHRLLCSYILLPQYLQPQDPQAAREYITISALNANFQRIIHKLQKAMLLRPRK